MGEIRKELAKGVFYTAIAKYAGILINIAITAILARLLTPADFGIIAIATVLIVFFDTISDSGIGPAIIQNKTLTRDDLSCYFSLTLYIGVLLSVIFFLVSSWISKFYGDDLLRPILQIMSVAIFFRFANIVPNALLQRNKRFRFIAIRTVSIQAVCGLGAIGCAYYGAGAYSLLIPPVFSAILLFIVSYMEATVPFTLKINKESISKILSYSLYQFLFSFINYFSRNLDKLVVGKVFGASTLGYYEKSYRLMMLPVNNLSHVISPAIQPIFSEYQNDRKWLYEKSMKIFELLAFVGLPLSVLLFFCSREIILIVLGEQWHGAIESFRILSLSVGFQMIYSPQGAFFQSANAVKPMFYNGLFTAFLTILGLVIGCLVFHSVIILCWMIVLSYAIAFFVTYNVMFKVVFHIPYKCFLKILIRPIIIAFIMFFAISVIDSFFDGYPIFIGLLVKVTVWGGIMLYSEHRYNYLKIHLNRKNKE